LYGARERGEAEQRNHIVGAWLCGLLSQVDPRGYPKLESMLAESTPAQPPATPAESSHNARLWGMWLKQQNKGRV